jgi:hypothetical protein
VYSLGENPHDETSNIEQAIPNQNLITKRTTQLDKNIDNANNSIALNGNNFTEETAKQAADALRKGNPVLVPKGSGGAMGDAIVRFNAPEAPVSAFNQLNIVKQDLRSIFGVEGINSTPNTRNETVRGMMMNAQRDTSRIGGSVGDSLEQLADNIYNWWIQMYYVFYDVEHTASIIGNSKAVETAVLSRDTIDRKIVVSVAPDSMKPKDELSQMNQALELFKMKAIDPKTLFTELDYPDPSQTAGQAVLYASDPQTYMRLNFPELFNEIQPAMPPAIPGGEGAGMLRPEQNISGEPASTDISQVPIQPI